MRPFFRGRHGGVVENLTNDIPPKKGFWNPPRTVRFPSLSGVSALFFLYKNPRQSRPEALLEGSKNFRESAFSGTFSSPHRFCTPPHITAQLLVRCQCGTPENPTGHPHKRFSKMISLNAKNLNFLPSPICTHVLLPNLDPFSEGILLNSPNRRA